MTENASAGEPAGPTAAPSPAPSGRGRGRRWGIRALLTLGMVLALVSVFAVWANRQLLSPDNWTETSSQLLENRAVQAQVAGFAVDQIYANVDVAGQIRGALPPRLAPLAGPVAGGLRNVAETAVRRALARPRVQQAWEVANRVTATQLVALVKDESRLVSQNGNAVVLDLRPLVIEMATRLGLPDAIASKIPQGGATIKIMRADQLSALQSYAKALGALATILPILALGSFGLAVLLDRDRRRVTLLWAGICLGIAGIGALILRNVVGNHVVDALATTATVRPAVEATWTIGTRMLVEVADATIMGAVPLVVAALLAGPSRWATPLRRAAAPTLRDRPAVVYLVEAAIVLAVLAWDPVPATHKIIPVIVMIAVLAIGVEALRRQVAREFPDARAGDTREAIVVRARALNARRRHPNGGAPVEDEAHEVPH